MISPSESRRLVVALQALEKLEEAEHEEKKRKHNFWVNPFLCKRELHDLEAHLLQDIHWENGNDYKNFCRMSIDKFELILNLVQNNIQKKDTPMRFSITARVRLAITLRFIATGDSYRSLEFLSRVSRKTIGTFVPQVLSAIYDALKDSHMKMPMTIQDWTNISNDFQTFWDFPHTLGAIDGKHIRIKAPHNSGSDFFNYKGFFSIVLLAVVDAHSRFIYIDVGGNGRASDVVVLKNSSLYHALSTDKLNIPPSSALKGQEVLTPFYLIGDDIFGLDKRMMKAYNRNSNLSTTEEIYNYRLSRARLTVEMAFGRLASRFRIFHRLIEVSVESTDILVKACCVLNNYLSPVLKKKIPDTECIDYPPLPETMTSLSPQEYNGYKYASRIRDNIKKYCVTDGDVPYQWKKIDNRSCRQTNRS